MYFTAKQIVDSINELIVVHPFYGITFLTCKKQKIQIGKMQNIALDAETDNFLKEHHRLNLDSKYYFQPFKSSDRGKKWVRHDYASSGLQKNNTTTFINAFLHLTNTQQWGWSGNYVSFLATKLSKKNKTPIKIPVFHLAVWLYREKNWPNDVSLLDIINLFLSDFHITSEEKEKLFDLSIPEPICDSIFQIQEPSNFEILVKFPFAPDAIPDQGGTLAYLETRGIGPATHFVLEPAERLTLITGDNGLGKSFLLECAWWALSGEWAEMHAYPSPNSKKAEITFSIEGENYRTERKTIQYDHRTSSWPQPKNRPTIPGLIVYARVDGSFAIWDPAKDYVEHRINKYGRIALSSEDVWNGNKRIEGLIRDWTRWQNNPQKYPFETFKKVLASLSPPDLGKIEPGESIRISNDTRDIPTIRFPYGTVPIVYASAGVRRIITLAYLIVWAWNEHIIAADIAKAKPQRRMVVLIDEMEAHLHPRWQRSILPALMTVHEMLAPKLEAQYIIATHSPLVMASAEPVFDSEKDALFHLDLASAGEVSLSEIEFISFGDVSTWLTSPVFELKHARSIAAEAAIEEAKALQQIRNPDSERVREVSEKLIKYLAQDDKFWPRWIYFAEKYGVQL